jgi:dipeptidase E
MTRPVFLASKHASGLSAFLPTSAGDLRTVFVPTAGLAYEEAPWLEKRRDWLRCNGFTFEDLELVRSSPDEVLRSLQRADLVFVEGGNTYFLLEHMRASGFWDAFAVSSCLYAGISAGAVVACPDVAFINGMDDRTKAPGLTSTAGAHLVGFGILPHADDPRLAGTIRHVLDTWDSDQPLVQLNDDQAILATGRTIRIVSSPPGGLFTERPPLANRDMFVRLESARLKG